MTFHHKRAEEECRKMGCLTKNPVLCRLIDFAALHPSNFNPPPTKSYTWAYRWRKILDCARRFTTAGLSDEKLIAAAGDSRRIRYNAEAQEWQVKGNGAPEYRQEVARIIYSAGRRVMPKMGRRKTGTAKSTKTRNQKKRLIELAEKLHRKADEILYFVAMGKRIRSDCEVVPKVEIPLCYRIPRKPGSPKAKQQPTQKRKRPCKSAAKQ
jgi:hypothetical protein